MSNLPLHPESVTVSAGRPHTPGAPLNPPIVLAAPFRHSDDANGYARDTGTETTRAVEAAVGALEGGTAIAFASGMAAVACIVETLPVGSVVVTPAQAYSGSVETFDVQEELGRLVVRRVDITDTDAVIAALDGAALVWLESVTNPMMGVVDVPAIAAAKGDATVVVDSTFTTPLNFRPLSAGADVVMHSSTKLIAGHSDLNSGMLVTSAERAAAFHHRRTLSGALLGSLEAFLTLRGLRTLAVRLERAQSNAGVLAARLAEHPAVSRVRYPGLADDPFHERAARLHDGFGAMISFELHGGADAAERACAGVELITHCTSLGGVESTMERRARYGVDATHGTPESLIRFSVGIEHVDDLWADLEQALTAS